MTDPFAVEAEAQRLTAAFKDAGAVPVSADVLLPADTLLDLYGEDIRARAYITADPMRGEMMLRPDFTVPVVQRHMETRADPARYTYAGKVFRRQEIDATRAIEYVQVGFEVFDGQAPAQADADVLATIWAALGDAPVRVATGDIGLLIAAVGGLRTTDARKAALMRHLWRPARFRALMDRYCGDAPTPAAREALLSADDPFADAGPEVGLRSMAEVETRIAALRADAAEPPISREERALVEAILGLQETLPNVLSNLRDIAVDMPKIDAAVARLAARIDALSAKGIDVDNLPFEGSYGRTTLEYYDGFVFGIYPQAGGIPIATGGRYDALTQQLGQGVVAPAVGGVIRPDLLLNLKGAA